MLSCTKEPAKIPGQLPKNDRERYGLYGNVKEIVESSVQPRQNSNNGLPTFLKKYSVSFNSHGNIETYRNYSSPDNINETRTYKYDTLQNLVEIKSTFADTTQNSRSVMEYDSDGNQISKTIWRRNSFLKHLFEYDSFSYPIKHMQIDPTDTTIVLITNKYDNHGRIIQKDQEDLDSRGFADELHKYTYDARGNMTAERKESALLGKFDFIYEYDKHNRLTKLITFDSISGASETSYDKFGKEVTVKTFKSPDDITTIEYEYTYDKHKNYIIRETFLTKRNEYGHMVKMKYSNELREIYYY
jgi:hypothetical protein